MIDSTKNDGKMRLLKFLGACLLFFLLFGNGLSTFLGFSHKPEVRQDKLYSTLFEPYWSALIEKRALDSVHYRNDPWESGIDAEKLAEAYKKIQSEHGVLKMPSIQSVVGIEQAQEEGELMDVKTLFEFEDGWSGVVSYKVSRLRPGQKWKIDESFGQVGTSLAEGPF